jgi:hypothetical protein
MLPQLAQGSSNKIFVIPSEFTQALGNIGSAIGGFAADNGEGPPAPPRRPRAHVGGPDPIDEKAAADAAEAAQAAKAAAAEAAGASGPLARGAGDIPPDPDAGAGPGTSVQS